MGKGYIYVFVRRKESLLARRLVFTELAKHAEWAEEEVGLYHFRDKRKREADIVLERPHGRIIGVEVKASATVRREDFNGLAALADFAGARFERGVLFYTGVHGTPVPPGGCPVPRPAVISRIVRDDRGIAHDRGAQVATMTFQLKRLVGGWTRQGPHPIE